MHTAFEMFNKHQEPKHLRICNNITNKQLPQYHPKGIHPNRLLPEIFLKALARVSLVKFECVTVLSQKRTVIIITVVFWDNTQPLQEKLW